MCAFYTGTLIRVPYLMALVYFFDKYSHPCYNAPDLQGGWHNGRTITGLSVISVNDRESIVGKNSSEKLKTRIKNFEPGQSVIGGAFDFIRKII